MIRAGWRLYYLFPLLLLLSCNNSHEYCSNQLSLIEAPDSLPKIPIDISEGSESVVDQIENCLGYKVCDNSFNFSYPLNNSSAQETRSKDTINLSVFANMSCGRLPVRSQVRSIFVILINQENNLLLDGSFGNVDSIKKWLPKWYLEEKIKGSWVTIKWATGVDNYVFRNVLKAVSDSYLIVADTVAMKSYGKGICDINVEQLQEIKESFHFRILFDVTEPLPPPLPDFDVN